MRSSGRLRIFHFPIKAPGSESLPSVPRDTDLHLLRQFCSIPHGYCGARGNRVGREGGTAQFMKQRGFFYWAHGRCQLPVGPMEFPGDSHESSQLPVTGFFETLKSQLSPQPVIVRDSGCGTRGGARVNTGSAPFYTSPTNRQFVHIRGPSTYNEIYKGNAFLLCFLFML